MKKGHCPQCGTQILVRDSGKFFNKKLNFMDVSLFYEDGIEVRVALCSTCANIPNIPKIMSELKDFGQRLPDREDLPIRSQKKA